MAEGQFVAYYRVSTQRQGESGLGLEAQQSAVRDYLNGGNWSLLAEFVEVESGAVRNRPELMAALEACRRQKACLVVAKLDRLARDAELFLNILNSGVEVCFVDLPNIPKGPVGRLMLSQLATFAEFERAMISQRTKAALKAAKARGTKLGNPQNMEPRRALLVKRAQAFAETLRPTLEAYQAKGLTQRQMVAELNALGVKTATGKTWSLAQLQRVLKRLAA